jgi:putative ABC transport system permease protein
MILNYSKIAFRNLLKNKLFSFINIIGMSVSLSIVCIIGLFVHDETVFDDHITSKTKYRLYNVRTVNDGVTDKLPIVPYPFAAYLQKDFPEIKNALRVMDTYGEVLFELEDKRINESGGVYAEAGFFNMFEIPVTQGNPSIALDKTNSIALSESLARKYFGAEPALGKTLKVSKQDYVVTAVYRDFPDRSHIRPPFVLSLQTLAKNWNTRRTENWVWQQFFTYVEFNAPVNEADFELKLKSFVEKYAYPKIEPEGFTYVPHLQSVHDIHLHSSDFEWEIADRGNIQTIYILGFTAGLILVIACLNFINLSTARSMKRMKEVGVRKVVGAARNQLVFQFITESVVLTFISLVLAIALVETILPFLNSFTGKHIADPFSLVSVVTIFFLTTILGILAGSYPAFYLSGIRPAIIFHQRNAAGGAAELFRKGLVVLQFSFSFFLIIGAMIVIGQHDLLMNRDIGFQKDQLMVLPMQRAHLARREATKQQFLSVPGVTMGTYSFGLPGDLIAGDAVIDPVTGKTLPTNLFCVDNDYIPTFGMDVIAGRNFSDSPSDSSSAFVINETAVKNFGLGSASDAIGKEIHWNRWGDPPVLMKGKVIGVVRDFNFRTLKEKIAPAVMVIHPGAYGYLTLRVEPRNLPATLSELKQVYESISTEWPFDYSFIDAKFAEMYKNESKLSTLLSWFASFAIFIACLGLFGLVEYSVYQRSKEISIRKVFGASIPGLLLLLTRRYFLLILIAFAIIVPISYYTAQEWLSTFAYRIAVTPLIFIKAAALMLVITVLTVSYQSVKAALTNPAEILKNE